MFKEFCGKIFKAVFTIVVVVVLVLLFYIYPVRAVKGIVFDNLGPDKFGDVVNQALVNPKWNSKMIGILHYEVTVKGRFGKEEGSTPLTLTFDVQCDILGSAWVELIACEQDGIYSTDFYTNAFVLVCLYGYT